jgi:hypothetical protein
MGCQQGKVDQKKVVHPNPIWKWNNFWYRHKKVYSKYI